MNDIARRFLPLIGLTLIALIVQAPAQRLTERWLTVNPLAADIQPSGSDSPGTDGGWSFLTLGHAWGEFGSYRISRDNDHAWSVKLGGFLELFRVGRDASLAFLSSVDLVSDPHNELRFNPRVMFWEEGFLYTLRAGAHFYQIGYYHRCKHDVDNLLPAPSYSIPVQRALMYGSLLGKILVPWSLSSAGTEGLLTLRADLYSILQDERLPRATFENPVNLEQAIATLGANFHSRFPLSERWLGGYAILYGSLTLFGEERGFTQRFRKVHKASFHGGISTGIVLQGRIHVRMGVSYEYLADTGINPLPNSADLVLLSLTILNPETMW